jgi:hypothetical protein
MSGETTQIILRPYALVLGKAVCPADALEGLRRITAEVGQAEVDRVAGLLEGLKTAQDVRDYLVASWANGQSISGTIETFNALGPQSDIPTLAAAARLFVDVGDGRLSTRRMDMVPLGLRSMAGLPSPRELEKHD